MDAETDRFSDASIVASWRKNALTWTAEIREGRIESRRLVTDQAIVDTILGYAPRSVLDLGCGEGWLVRELATRHLHVIGTDAVPALIEQARHAGGGDFRVLPYESLSAEALGSRVDVVVCNFALLGKASVEQVFRVVPTLLNVPGLFIIQTLHPVLACGDLPYRDGWREGSWAGFGTGFTDPAPWYFRTLESWSRLFAENGFRLRGLHEPIHPETRKPASVILVGEVPGKCERGSRE